MLITPNKQNNQNLRPPTNDRTCIGWHERYGGVLPCLEGHLRPEALNLTAWNLMLMDSKKTQTNLSIYLSADDALPRRENRYEVFGPHHRHLFFFCMYGRDGVVHTSPFCTSSCAFGPPFRFGGDE